MSKNLVGMYHVEIWEQTVPSRGSSNAKGLRQECVPGMFKETQGGVALVCEGQNG